MIRVPFERELRRIRQWNGLGSLLILLVTVAGAYQLFYTAQVITDALFITSRPRQPFSYGRDRKVEFVQKEASGAVLPGDQIESIDGKPFLGSRLFDQAIRTRAAGDALKVSVRHSGGARADVVIRLAPRRSQPVNLPSWFVLLTLSVCLPALCLALGFASAFLRIRNPLAWLLLMLMVSFSQLIVEPTWAGPLQVVVQAYRGIAEKTLGIWILLFGIYFPGRSNWDRAWPWVKWVLITCVAVVGAVRVFDETAVQQSFALVGWLTPYNGRLRTAFMVLTALCVLGCLSALAGKWVHAVKPDEARRLKLLFASTLFSFGPLLTVIVVGAIKGTPGLLAVPRVVAVCCALMIAAFPLTVMHLILAPQVLELRLLIREGLLNASAARALGGLRLATLTFTAGALLLLASRFDPATREEVELVAYGPMLVLLLQPGVISILTGWLDRRFFADARKREIALASLTGNSLPSRSISELASIAASGVLQALACSRVAILVERGGAYVSVVDLGGGDPAARAVDAKVVCNLRRNGKPSLVYFDDPSSWVHSLGRPERELLAALGTRVLVTLKYESETLGMLSLGSKLPDQAFSGSELALLDQIGKSLSLGLRNCRLVADLEQETRRRERLNAEREAADQANQAKSAFLANMSHELRTPLNAVLGYSEMLRETAEEIGQEEMVADLDRIHSAGQHLLTLINAVLDISKIEAGKMDVEIVSLPLEKFVKEVVDIARPAIEKKGNKLVCILESDLSSVRADEIKFRQVLLNLLSNAGKFTSGGTVTLTVRRRAHSDSDWIYFEVLDTGIGMTREQMTKLFQPFVQASSEISRKFGGTGLGLVLSRRFCQLMGGDITVDSEPGVGSNFTAKLPADADGQSVPSSPQQLEEAVSESDRTVLVIDDDANARDLFRRYLERSGYKVVAARNGADGLQKAREIRPIAIALDVMMPGTDGWRVLSTLKQDAELSRIPVVMTSAVDNSALAYSLGANGYLIKPVERGQLIKVLSEVRADDTTVLVVDPDAAARTAARQVIQTAGFHVLEASSGREAFHRLAERPIKLIVLDLALPDMDGMSFLADVRNRQEWAEIPVLVSTDRELDNNDRLWLSERVSGVIGKGQLAPGLLSKALPRHMTAGAAE